MVGALRAHALAGRLQTDELEERIAGALGARTRGELAALTADLPPSAVAARRREVSPLPPIVVRGWGLRPFHQTHLLRAGRPVAFTEAVQHVVPLLFAAGYDLVSRDEPAALVFEASSRPAWVPLVCVFAFPVGLLALAARTRHRIILTFDQREDGTLMTVQGEAGRAVRKAFAALREQAGDGSGAQSLP